ncbi:MAG: DEAD/DEAH box helicase, partial [Pseudomonadales bacterium]|nr:DEAD/DEAH box helicase [Pseudomonadales bacterium]
MNQDNFAPLGLSGKFCRAVGEQGYETPTPIQALCIPYLLEGRDLLGIAQTGTGKTAAFALPILQRLDEARLPARSRKPRALILAPTRELALQISGEFEQFGRHARLRHACIFGGVGAQPQIKALNQGVDILVATPGRLLDLASQRFLDLSEVEVLVLDEADRLLDMGFIRDVRRIVNQTPKSRQSLLFSATMPREVSQLAEEILKNPQRVDVSPKEVTVKQIDQRVVMVDNGRKLRVLERLLRDDEVSRAIVFTRTKHGA